MAVSPSLHKATLLPYILAVAVLATAQVEFTTSYTNNATASNVVPFTPTTLITMPRETSSGATTLAPAPLEPESLTAEQPPAVQPSLYQVSAERANVRLPSTTWRYDPRPVPRPTARPCNELNEMAFASYRHTMGLCKKAAGATPDEVKKMIKELSGYNFLPDCEVSPPVGCCSDPYEMMNAERCFTWWPSPEKPTYFEPPPGLEDA